ncbi:hypothetical protein BCO18430_03300 [Burkholderia contaminans]|uniref:hypothetical protein n=1 Tax=Burkholderia contaminans TaxID=488447 RepID=UPI001452AEA6|nr:hypothetical protein [Burkholderia contaminans]VWC91799.1 hypothetical protein BCO18430_03300 [Burkholderia contaminans]
MSTTIQFPTVVRDFITFNIGGLPCTVTRVDNPAGETENAPARDALFSLQIGDVVLVYSTETHIRALIAALERDAAYADQANAERFLQARPQAAWRRVEVRAPGPAGSKTIDWRFP